jgi:outer membrane protein OmpA-like peptidoglycan-associated protein
MQMSARGICLLILAAGTLSPPARAESPTSFVAVGPKVPLVKGLRLIGAVNEQQGDYESSIIVDSVEPDGGLHLITEANVPDPSSGSTHTVSVSRAVRAVDMVDARTYKYVFFTDGEEEFPGTTSIGTSAIVLSELRAQGHTTLKLDGGASGIAGMLTGLLGMMGGPHSSGPASGASASGTLKTVEPRPVPFHVLVNGTPVSLLAWHLKGRFGAGDQVMNVEWYILDDPKNPLSLRFAFGEDKRETVRIAFPVENESGILERALEKERRAVLYGIYFDFNSARIKPQSAPVLDSIVAVMKKDPDWILSVEGHTDNIGAEAQNRDLSSRRAAAVKEALVARGIAPKRLHAAGFGASVPRDTNATLAGRAQNRRVELARQ